MTLFRLLAPTALMIAGLLAAPQPASAAEPVVARAVEGFVRPAYAAFAADAGGLSKAVDQLCARPSAETLKAAREAFPRLAFSWSQAEIITFGPLAEDNRLERVLYWPDRKGIGLKQIQAAIGSQDAGVEDVATLATKSVALQGLGALEFVLFGTGADVLVGPAGAHRCRFGAASAASIGRIAAEASQAWSDPGGIAARWSEPGPGNALYDNADEARTELLDVFVHGLEMVRDVRLNGFLGKTAADDKPRSAMLWRSGATVASLRGTIAGLRSLYEAADFRPLLHDDQQWIDQSIRFEFANAVRALEAADRPVADGLADQATRKKLDYARIVTSSLSETFRMRLADALGLTAGFSSLDGD